LVKCRQMRIGLSGAITARGARGRNPAIERSDFGTAIGRDMAV